MLNQMNTVHNLTHYFFKTYFNVSLLPITR